MVHIHGKLHYKAYISLYHLQSQTRGVCKVVPSVNYSNKRLLRGEPSGRPGEGGSGAGVLGVGSGGVGGRERGFKGTGAGV